MSSTCAKIDKHTILEQSLISILAINIVYNFSDFVNEIIQVKFVAGIKRELGSEQENTGLAEYPAFKESCNS